MSLQNAKLSFKNPQMEKVIREICALCCEDFTETVNFNYDCLKASCIRRIAKNDGVIDRATIRFCTEVPIGFKIRGNAPHRKFIYIPMKRSEIIDNTGELKLLGSLDDVDYVD